MHVLIVDDSDKHARTLARNLSQYNFDVSTATNSAESLRFLAHNAVNVILLDIILGDELGLDVLERYMTLYPDIPVIMITAYGTVPTAVTALKKGAADYLQKPLNIKKLVDAIQRHTNDTRSKDAACGADQHIVTLNHKMLDLLEKARKIAEAELPVLIYGESGTGKELLAEFIHNSSLRRANHMVKLNCASLPETLLENELFGHEPGAYTGANKMYHGVFELAMGSSLFLDEIGDMSLSTQSKILRAIQNREVRRLGGSTAIEVDIRFIAATNRRLEQLIHEKAFRSDLYFRLNTCVFELPPLRARTDDIELLSEHFLSAVFGSTSLVSRDVMDIFKEYTWPGNIRELMNTLQYAATVDEDGLITDNDLPDSMRTMRTQSFAGFRIEEDERSRIISALRRNGYNRDRTATSLGISRSTLFRKMKHHEIR